eukprot:TRINITY_DN487_c1_g1_i1.p1 TRINITY_DN487_c1_g1~~TRINITY_DN487_c1_g1_i1.p1  ORF type:complete len:283 (+),score=138.84 TRINITY_DN487_c1_g1_i1:267-1115(+)
MDVELTDEDLQKLYAWVDEIPLSRPKRNIARDFSDGVLTAEVVAHYFPRLVELHNYSAANSVAQKLYNWGTLNTKVFRRLAFQLQQPDIEALAQCKPGAVEKLLYELQLRMANYRAKQRRASATSAQSGESENGQDTSQTGEDGSDRGGGGGAAGRPAAGPNLRGVVTILEQKVARLEQLVHMKDLKIARLEAALQAAEDALDGERRARERLQQQQQQQAPPQQQHGHAYQAQYQQQQRQQQRQEYDDDQQLSADFDELQLQRGGGGAASVRRMSGKVGRTS